MNGRIKKLRKELNLTQEEFSSRIGLSRNFIAQIEIGTKQPSDRTISDICREFNINEEWLRTGEGDMYSDKDLDFATICSKIGATDPKAQQAIIDYWHLSDDDKELFLKFIDKFMH